MTKPKRTTRGGPAKHRKVAERPEKALECFSEAVHCLAVGERDVRRRLIVAGPSVMRVWPEWVPKRGRLRQDVEWIRRRLTRHPAMFDNEGAIQATVRRMRNSTGSEIAERIVSVYHRLLADRL